MTFATRSVQFIRNLGGAGLATLGAVVTIAISPLAAVAQDAPQVEIQEGPVDQIQVIGSDPNGVVAEVNGEPVTERDLALAAQSITSVLSQLPREQWRGVLIDQAIAQELIIQAAIENGIEQSEDFQLMIQDFRRQTLSEFFLTDVVDPMVTDEDVRAEYDRLIADLELPAEVLARVIMVETESDAVDALRRLEAGENFADLASEVSLSATAEVGGLLSESYFSRDQLPVQIIADALFDTEPGGFYPAPINYEGFWYLLAVDDRRQRAAPAFDDETAQAIRQQLISDIYNSLIEEMVATAEVDVIVPELGGDDASEEDAAPADGEEQPAEDETPAEPAAGN